MKCKMFILEFNGEDDLRDGEPIINKWLKESNANVKHVKQSTADNCYYTTIITVWYT